MRIGGIASGIDTESLLENLVRAERIPIDRVYQRKVLAEWRRDAYRDINTKLLRLRNSAFDMRLQSQFRTSTATSSNPNVLTATTTGGSQAATYYIKVQELAKAGSMQTTEGVQARLSQFWSDVSSQEEGADSYSLRFRGIDGNLEEVELKAADKISDIVGKINANSNIGVTAFYDSYRDAMVLSTKNTGVSSAIEFAVGDDLGELDFVRDVLGVDFFSSKSGEDVTKNVSISNDPDANTRTITLEESALQEGFKLTIGERTYALWDSSELGAYPNETEAAQGLKVPSDRLYDISGGDLAGFLSFVEQDLAAHEDMDISIADGALVLGMKEGSEEELGTVFSSFTHVRGSNAKLMINDLETERESNTFALSGTNITLTSANPDSVVTLGISQDVDAAMENIREFVDLYNEIIDELNGMLRQPAFRDFPPLTDEQKEAMSDKEVERWEENARSGLLRNDSLVSGVLTDMRQGLMGSVEGLEGITSLSQIGIRTGAWQENGKLHINETELRKALTEDLDGVIALFSKDAPSEAEGSAAQKQMGIARRLYSVLGTGMDRIVSTAGRATSLYDQSFLGNQIRRYEERMDKMEERVQRAEQRYWNQFTAMERAMSEMNSQSDWLYQQLISFNGGR